MCGRYVSPDTAAIERAWQIGRTNSNPFRRRFNVAPTMQVPILRGNPASGELELVEARWGFIPSWWKQARPPPRSFNARSEDAASKPMWRHYYRHSRCLIPAEGWYEWQTVEKPNSRTGEIKTFKQPNFILRPDRKLLSFAGLMAAWTKEGQDSMLTCAVLTRDASGALSDIHNRMPVVLRSSVFDRWLSPDAQASDDVASMVAEAMTEFEHYPVSTRLNSAKADDENLIEPLKVKDR